jgi:hypothetical protein
MCQVYLDFSTNVIYKLAAMIKTRKFFLVFLLFPMLPLFGQQSPYLDHIQLTEQSGKVFLQWVMTTGAICEGIDVYRSADAQLFERVGRIPGICGSPDFAVGFDFVDESPLLNQVNFYRLEMGNLGVSPVVSILVMDYSLQQYQLIPHPLKHEGKLYFKHRPGEYNTLIIYDMQGKKVQEMEGNTGVFTLTTELLKASTYIFRIIPKGNSPAIHGTLMVVN